MRVLRQGFSGDDVRALQYFLRGEELYLLRVDGIFGHSTTDAVRRFQQQCGITSDGVVGRLTYAKAFEVGFDPLEAKSETVEWPPPPPFKSLSSQERGQVYGHIEYRPAGRASNPEAVVVTNNWVADHVIRVVVPQLADIPGTTHQGKTVSRGPANGRVDVHKLVAVPLQDLWQAWDDADLCHLVKTWDGLGNTRFIRGSRTRLSNHAYYSAFDINYRWNMLGRQPALKGRTGSVRELVPIANEMGWYWGGHFPSTGGRADGMHFAYVGKQS